MATNGVPSGYTEIGRWGVREATVRDISLAGAASLILLFLTLVAVTFMAAVTAVSDEITIEGSSFIVGFLIGAVVGVVLHELVHGAAFSVFHAHPRYGFKPWTRFGPVFYASAPGCYLSRTQFLIAGLAPALLLTASLAVALMAVFIFASAGGLLSNIVVWAFLLNAIGSAGDLVIATKTLAYPPSTYFEDTGDGFVAYGPPSTDL